MSGPPTTWDTYEVNDPEYIDPYKVEEDLEPLIKQARKEQIQLDKHQKTSIIEWWNGTQNKEDDSDDQKT